MAKPSISEQTVKEAMAVAKATQKPNQTKEQTKLIAKGIEKGIAEYKQRQKSKARDLDKKRKKLEHKQQMLGTPGSTLEEQPQDKQAQNKLSLLGYALFVLSLLWIVFHQSTAHALENNLSVQQRLIQPQDLVYMMTSEGLIIYEVLPQVAPNHAQRFKDLVTEGFYQGLGFYRVIDGFVAQAGEGEQEWDNVEGKPSRFKAKLNAEFTRPLTEQFELIQSPEFLAPETGFIDSVPAGRDRKTKEEWLLHCPAMVAMARDTSVDSASTEFYINIGHAPRHLDRNMSVFARVVFGLEVAQSMSRGDKSKGGIVSDASKRTRILWAKIGTDIEQRYKKQVRVDLPGSKRFQARLTSAKNKTHPFYAHKGNGVVDVCYYQPQVDVE